MKKGPERLVRVFVGDEKLASYIGSIINHCKGICFCLVILYGL